MLINRVADTDERWHQEVTIAAPRVSPIIDLTLDDIAVKRAIDNLNFIQVRCMFCLCVLHLYAVSPFLRFPLEFILIFVVVSQLISYSRQ